MVIAEEMNQTVHQQTLNFHADPLSESLCLPAGSGHGNHNISEHFRPDRIELPFLERKGEDIRGFVLGTITPVQRPHGPVADKQDAQFRIRQAYVPQQAPELFLYSCCWRAFFLQVAFYQDVHFAFFLQKNPRLDNQYGGGKCQ